MNWNWVCDSVPATSTSPFWYSESSAGWAIQLFIPRIILVKCINVCPGSTVLVVVSVLYSLTRLAPRMIQISLIKSWSFAKKVKYDNYPDDGSCQSEEGKQRLGGDGRVARAWCIMQLTLISSPSCWSSCTHLANVETIRLNLSLRYSWVLHRLRWWSEAWWGESDGWDTESSADIHHTISLHGGDHISEELARSGDPTLWWSLVSRYKGARVVLINRPNYWPGPGAEADCSISGTSVTVSTNQEPDDERAGAQ